MYMCIYIYIERERDRERESVCVYIYIYRERERSYFIGWAANHFNNLHFRNRFETKNNT